MVLDHLIATVPDLRATHARLLGLGFEEAWPPGPFWPASTTSGVALGGANLELVQRDAIASFGEAGKPSIGTLVFAPASLEEGRAFLSNSSFEERVKVEPDPALLTLRGFPPSMAATPQTICTNLHPLDPPYPFFLCLYAPFLKARLAPANFATPRGAIVGLDLLTTDVPQVEGLFAGALAPIHLVVDADCHDCVEAIRFADGSVLSSADL